MIVNTPNIFKINRLVKTIKISNIFSFLLVACRLLLVACGLALVAYLLKKLPAAGQIGGGQRAVVLSEPGQQVVVFNSFHIILSLCPVEVLNSATGPEG